MKLEWTDDGVKTIMGPIPAAKWDESRGRKIWFNSMVAAYTGWKDARNENDPVKAVTFGDGRLALARRRDRRCGRILEEECVAVPWQHTATSSSSTTGPSCTPAGRSNLHDASLLRSVNKMMCHSRSITFLQFTKIVQGSRPCTVYGQGSAHWQRKEEPRMAAWPPGQDSR
ncbi:hypothetical protein PVAP13_9KG434623 [Panicum virgatum]|uniref:Uncharacterized protein n=1 Tax=Panicum virgatum TaxID=38727 RepID=A0A8T0NS72_PANVG|nr:hypothetical protein PVAP13_9KG434623 [Panicum virgatum]